MIPLVRVLRISESRLFLPTREVRKAGCHEVEVERRGRGGGRETESSEAQDGDLSGGLGDACCGAGWSCCVERNETAIIET